MTHAQVLRVSRALDHTMAVVATVAKRVERGFRGRDHRCDVHQSCFHIPLHVYCALLGKRLLRV